MIAGQTVQVTVGELPLPCSLISRLKVIYKNPKTGQTVLTKNLTDMTVGLNSVQFTLTQAESLALPVGRLERSVVILSTDGVRSESLPQEIEVLPSALGEVLS